MSSELVQIGAAARPPYIAAQNGRAAIWAMLGAIALVDVVWLAVAGVALAPVGVLKAVAVLAIPLAAATAIRRLRGADNEAALFAESPSQLLASALVFQPLNYLAVTLGLPFRDAFLAGWDAALGFDWLGFLVWVDGRPLLRELLDRAYDSVVLQTLAVALILSYGEAERMRAFVWAILVASLVTLAVSAPFPALGAYPYYGVVNPTLTLEIGHVEALRSGAMRHLELGELQGLVTFPSFHTALAVLFVWAVRHSRLLLALALPLNLAMLASTLVTGGHYLIDLPAGVAVALLATFLATRLARS